MRIGLNGCGRIGRCVLRAAAQDERHDIVAINDMAAAEDLQYLLQYDSVHGQLDEVHLDGDALVVDGERIPVYNRKSPAALPWDEHGVDLVFEATGAFRHEEDAAQHLDAGADQVLLSAPPKSGDIPQYVYGVNHDEYSGERIVSNASCTTNCLAPMAKVLHDRFGIRSGMLTTVHAYTGSQNLIDRPPQSRKKRRRARAAAENIVPTSTGAADAVTTVIPELEGRLDGMAMRVPTPNGSISDLVVDLDADVSVDDVNAAFREAANNGMAGVLDYTEDDLVSQDIIGNPHSTIVDGGATMQVESGLFKVLGWYDNEYGFACRMLDMAAYMER